MKFLDPDDPFFRKPWVRWATVLVPVLWGILELAVFGSPMFGVIFLAAGAYAGYMLFLKRKGD
jgi:hypothetical protein